MTRTFVIGLVAFGATIAQGVTPPPRFGTMFDKRLTTNELGTVTQIGATMLPTTAFVDDGHGGWALDGAAFAEKGVALYADGTKGGWNATLTGSSGSEIAADWVLSMRAKVGGAGDQILWYLRYGGNNAVGCYLRTVPNGTGGLDLSLEWTLGADIPPCENVILTNVDTTDFHHYVIACSQSGGSRLFVDGVQKWQANSIKAYMDAEGTKIQYRTPYSKSYNSLWLGRVEGKTNVGAGDWTTVYDDVRFYSTNDASDDSSVPTDEEIAALTDEAKAERVLPPMPAARLAVTFSDRTLADSAGVITQVGADALPQSAFRRSATGGYTLYAARLPDGQQGVCLYEQGTTWKEGEIQQLCGVGNETPCSYAISFVAKIAPTNGAAVCFLHYGKPGIGAVLYTVTNDVGGTDLAFTFLGSTARKAYPNILARNIDTENYHHYVLTCSRSGGQSTRPVRLWIDNLPVDLFTDTALTVYDDDNQATRRRSPAEKGFSGLYLAAARGAELACTASSGTRFGDVRFFAGEGFTDGFGPCAIDPEGIDVLCRTLMPYADPPRKGARVIIR